MSVGWPSVQILCLRPGNIGDEFSMDTLGKDTHSLISHGAGRGWWLPRNQNHPGRSSQDLQSISPLPRTHTFPITLPYLIRCNLQDPCQVPTLPPDHPTVLTVPYLLEALGSYPSRLAKSPKAIPSDRVSFPCWKVKKSFLQITSYPNLHSDPWPFLQVTPHLNL